jgi:uncharacterized protein (DUF1015 family)
MALLVPASGVRLHPFHRLVVNGPDPEWLRAELVARFGLSPAVGSIDPPLVEPGSVGVALGDRWYRFGLQPAARRPGLRAGLDVQRLHDQVLAPLFGITDPRSDSRLRFVPGVAGVEELMTAAATAGFALHPPSMDQLIAVADAGELMPPKSTYASPKPLAGLVVRLRGD